jgi:sugar phosphate isomerase/epimerase
MKLSIVLSAQPSSFSALLYQGNLAENVHKVKELGFDGVELAVRDPARLQLPDLERILYTERLQVPAIGTGQACLEDGLSFTHPEAGIRRRAVERIISHLNMAEKLGAIVIIGLIRGQKITGIGSKQAKSWLIEALRDCAAADKKVRLAIEPINRYETDLLNSVEQSLHFLDDLKVDTIGLLLDTFHMNIEERSISESIQAAGKRLFHFHVADSNRWYPGAGHINFRQIIRSLDKIGYNGFISGEFLPQPDPETAAVKMIEYFNRLQRN